MNRLVLLVVLLALASASHPGGMRMRLLRRWPGCRGTIEGVYAGDEWSFLERVEFSLPSAFSLQYSLGGVMLLEKDRGEEWVDLVSGGLSLESQGYPGLSVYAGWLKAVRPERPSDVRA